jgi:hypothetical protein
VSSHLIAASVLHLYFSFVAYGRPKTIHTVLILIEKLVNCTQMLIKEGWGDLNTVERVLHTYKHVLC